jgi:hypothetical protein
VVKYSLRYARKLKVKLDNEHWYEDVPKLLEISPESKVNILRNLREQTDRTVRKY